MSDKTGGTFEQWVHPKALDYFETQLGFKRCVCPLSVPVLFSVAAMVVLCHGPSHVPLLNYYLI